MGGPSFLLNKKFHPVRLDNQKRVFIAEEEHKKKKAKEEEAARLAVKEAELSYLEKIGQVEARDIRSAELKFMYNIPKSIANTVPQGKPTEIEDPHVTAFWKKINDKNSKKQELSNIDCILEDSKVEDKIVQREPFDRAEYRHRKDNPQKYNPLLVNAPVEGDFVKDLSKAKFKPLGVKIRNVQCFRCGEWGHQIGDRECPLRDFNPHDLARQQREDPMNYLQGDKIAQDKQKLILNQATLGTTFGNDSIRLKVHENFVGAQEDLLSEDICSQEGDYCITIFELDCIFLIVLIVYLL